MPRLMPVSWKKFEKFLLSAGCAFVRENGDHRVYYRQGLKRPLILPRYPSLPLFIIRNNLRLLDISVEQYLKILEELC